MKEFLKKTLSKFGLRLTRTRHSNRFQAMDEVLILLRTQGFVPTLVIDAGANKGQWAALAFPIFVEATFHIIEPQLACQEALTKFAKAHSQFRVYFLAVTEPGLTSVTMLSVDESGNTGAYVDNQNRGGGSGLQVKASTLDSLMVPQIRSGDRLLLKLDLEGHELQALHGAEKVLNCTEVVLLETHIYDPEGLGRSTFAEVCSHLNERGFLLYDVASLSPRQRDGRLRQADLVFVRSNSPLMKDNAWS